MTGYWVSGTRVSLDSVVSAFLQGLSPEVIASERFPNLVSEAEEWRNRIYLLPLSPCQFCLIVAIIGHRRC